MLRRMLHALTMFMRGYSLICTNNQTNIIQLTFGPGKAKTNFDYDKNDMFPLPNVAMESIVPPPIPPSNNESGGVLYILNSCKFTDSRTLGSKT